MSKALWFVITNMPLRPPETLHRGHFPTLDEIKQKMEKELRRITREPLQHGRTTHDGPIAQIESGVADSAKLQIVEFAREPSRY